MAAELGVAYVSIVPEAKGLGRKIAKEFGAVDKAAESTGRSAGSKLMGAMGAAVKKVALGAVVGAGVAVGAALVSGFKSAIDQQNIQATVAGLYQDAGKAFSTLSEIKALSKTSPIDYSAYGKAAQSLAYAGVQGDQAITVLDKVGWAIVGAGGGATELDRAMAGLLKGVNNGGIVMNDTLAMISESGYPIIDGLSAKFGTTGDVIKKMAADGEISIDDVLSVMENGTGKLAKSQADAGKEVAKTLGSQWAIAKDNISVAIGETMLPLLEKIAPAMGPISDAIVDSIEKMPGIFDRVKNAAQTALGVLRTWSPVIFGIVGAVAAWNIVQAISNTLSWAAYLWQSRYVLMGAARIAITNGMALAQRGLNAAMRANPIGLIIAGIMLLIGAVVMAYQNIGWFRDLVDTAWAAIKVAISAVVDWFTGTAWPFMKTILDALGAAFMWLWQSVIVPAWNGIWGAIQAAWGFIKPIFDFIVNAIVNYLVVYFQVLWTFIQVAWKGIQIAIQIAWNIIKVIFNAIVGFVNNVLAPVFQWFWNWVIKPVWSGIQLAIQLAWGAIKIIFAAIKWYIDNVLAPVFRWLYNNVIKPVWDGIKSTINTIWVFIRDKIFTPIKAFMENVLGPAFQWLYDNVIKPVWGGIKSSINTVWKFVRDKVFDPMKTAVSETVPDAFEAGKDAIAEAWNKIKDVAKKPVKFVIDTVINKGIIDNFNKIAGIFDVDKIDHVTLPKGFATGGYTGAGRKYKPAGIVHADEYVIRKESQQKISRTHGRGALDYMNRTGRIPGMGYAKGGKVGGGTLIDAANWWVNQGARGSRHPAFGGAVRSGHSRGSLHYQDRAVDLNYGPGGQNATEMAFFDRLIGQFKSLFPGIRTIWRAPGHYNHMHIDTSNGADIGDFSGSSSGGGLLNILNPFQGLFDKIKSGITSDGMFGDLVAGGAKKMVQAPIDWIKSKASMIGDVFEGVQDAVGTGTTKARVRAVATARGWGIGQQWRDLSALIQQESSWNKNAANPSSSARGLFQKMTSLHGPLEKTVEGQAGWGLNYIKRTYGTPSAAWAFHKRNNWYAGGGHVSPTLYDKGGVLQPGTSLVANKTRKPEYILPAKVTDALMSGSATSGERKLAEQIILQGSPEETLRALDRRERKRDLLYAR